VSPDEPLASDGLRAAVPGQSNAPHSGAVQTPPASTEGLVRPQAFLGDGFIHVMPVLSGLRVTCSVSAVVYQC